MASQKQVMDIRSCKEGISSQESNEQQRNWSDHLWKKKEADSLSNYDSTRAHLNFEVTKGGIVQPIDKRKTIMEKFRENLAQRGIKDPNSRTQVRRLQRTIAQMIFMGSHDRMNELAFGSQTVKGKGEDNSMLQRNPDIEHWACDIYHFLAKKFGEENIISFYVHLDEKTPHVHCSLVPVVGNRISWKSVFGNTKEDGETILRNLHDELEKEVNRKWGLERGNSISETKAKHRSTAEYKSDLISQVNSLEMNREELLKLVRKEERKLKSLSTMIANLLERKNKIMDEINQLSRQFGQEGIDTAILAEKMRALRMEMDDINKTLEKRNRQIEEANETLAKAHEKLIEINTVHSQMQSYLGDNIEKRAVEIENNIVSCYNKMVADSLNPILPTLSPQQQTILENSDYYNLTENAQDVINCALLLAIHYIDGATTYAHSCGGGGGNLSGWGRNKEDDDERWWMRCINKSAEMVRPMGRRSGRRR